MVVGAAASVPGRALIQQIVGADAEVHTLDSPLPTRCHELKPGLVPGLASHSECDLDDLDAVAAVVQRVGAVINHTIVFVEFVAAPTVTRIREAVRPLETETSQFDPVKSSDLRF